MIPEYVVEDLANFMMVVQQVTVSHDQTRTDDVILACTALMGSPAHVKNPYRRFQLCTVLHQWLPNSRCAMHALRTCPVACPWISSTQGYTATSVATSKVLQYGSKPNEWHPWCCMLDK